MIWGRTAKNLGFPMATENSHCRIMGKIFGIPSNLQVIRKGVKSRKFDFGPDQASHFGATCPCVTKRFPHKLVIFFFPNDLPFSK